MKLFRSEAKAQPATPPAPRTTVIHQPSEVGPLLAKAGIVLASPVVLWFMGLFLFGAAGIRQPKEALAKAIIWAICIGLILLVIKHFVITLLDKYYAHDETIEQEKTRQIQYKQLMTQSVVKDSRTTGEHQRLVSLIYMIMLDAYDHVAKEGPYTGSWRPWSRRPAAERVLVTLGETAPVGEKLGGKVRPLLEKHQVIVNDQLNTERYQSIADVQRLLYQPILVKQQAQLPAQSGSGGASGNWTFIE